MGIQLLFEVNSINTKVCLVWLSSSLASGRGRSSSLLSAGFLIKHHLEGSSSVSEELWINTLERLISLSGWTFDTQSMSFLGLVVSGMVLRLGHLESNYTRIFAIYLIITNTIINKP